MPYTITVKFVDETGSPLIGETVSWRLSRGDGTAVLSGNGDPLTAPEGILRILNVPDQPAPSPDPAIATPTLTGALPPRRGPGLGLPVPGGMGGRRFPELFFEWTIGTVTKPNIKVSLSRPDVEIGRQTYKVPLAAPAVDISNPDRNWLTYESLFNKDQFRKPCAEFKLELYLIPVNNLTIWLRDELSAADLQTFVNSFFPDFETSHINKLANSFWSWKEGFQDFFVMSEDLHESTVAAKDPVLVSSGFYFSPRKPAGNRDQLILYQVPYAVLPYNRYDNEATSRAIGTQNYPGSNLLRVRDSDEYKWSAWKTASRSCVVRLPAAPVKPKGQLWKNGRPDSIARNFENWTYSAEHRGTGYKTFKSNPYSLPGRIDHRDFSLKTGVEFVGDENQGGLNHKDVIGDWLIGCLRSDYITKINKDLRPPSADLIILTELITITEKDSRSLSTFSGKMDYKEGIQIRDISPLKKDHIYLAPLNVPFVDTELKEFKTEYFFFDEDREKDKSKREAWHQFWKYAFAAALGRAKALFLLRYGLQILNPNQQNFLIEFKIEDGSPRPTGTIVFRDLNDASLHREVIWALFDGPGEPPADKHRLAELSPPTVKFEFDPQLMRKQFPNQDDQETGTTGAMFGPAGTQFLWQRFSSFGNITKPAKGVGDNVKLLRNILFAMSDWGMAHDKSYISCVESHFGVNFRRIDWYRYPNSSRLKFITDIKSAEEQAKPKVWNPSATGIHRISGFKVEKLSDKIKGDFSVKLSASGDERHFFETEECLIISGTNFPDNVSVILGNSRVESKFIVGNNTTIIVSSKAAGIESVNKGERDLTVVNGVDGTVAEFKFISDTEYLSEMEWEERSASVIHEYLRSPEGQAAIKKMKGGWTPATPRFRVKFTGQDGKPFAWKRIFLRQGIEIWTDLTDGAGTLVFYSGNRDDLELCPQKDENFAMGSEWLRCQNVTWESIRIELI